MSAAVYVAELGLALYLMRRWLGVGITLGTTAGLGLGLAVGVTRGVAWSAVVPVERIELGPILAMALGYAGLVALAEEVHFRGLLQGVLMSALGTGRALLLGALLFAIPHLFLNGPLWILLFVADGLLFGALRLRTGALGPPIVAHAIGNVLTGSVLVAPGVVDDSVAVAYLALAVTIDLTAVALLLRWPRRQEAVAA
jgi:hypothetical protein